MRSDDCIQRSNTVAIGVVLVVLMLGGGCTEQSTAPSVSDAVAPQAPQAPQATDSWLGQWNGPEGTLLLIAGGNGAYQVTVRNLDGPQTFSGSAVDGGIEFERAGTREFIRATDGTGTGMKWLVEKHQCLVIRPGEGFCRD